jgi:hypothetical protein
MTPAPPPGPFGICGSSELTSQFFGICGSAKLTRSLAGSHGFSVMSSNLPTYEGKYTFDDITAFLFGLEQHLKNAIKAIGWVGTTGW